MMQVIRHRIGMSEIRLYLTLIPPLNESITEAVRNAAVDA